MALEKMRNILKMADENNTAVIGFNCIDYSMIYAAITSAERLRKPVICMLYPEHVYRYNAISLAGFAAMVRDLAGKVTVPVGLHLDHSNNYAFIMDAIRCGFQSVMYDGSVLPLEENALICGKVAETAHLFDVDVEAEIGHVGLTQSNDGEKTDLYTKPDAVALFMEQSGADSVAVAIGNAHGVYTQTPHLDLERLDAINAATQAPLVLHGGTGIPDDQMAQAFCRGINKLNVGTEYLHLWKEKMHAYAGADEVVAWGVPEQVQQHLLRYMEEKLLLTQMSC